MDTNHIPQQNPGDETRMEQRLWNYIDGHAGAEEQSVIGKLLQTDNAWKAKYAELLELNELLHSSELETPSMRFTKNVMEEIGALHVARAAKSYINKKIIWGLGIFFFLLFAGFLAYGFSQMNFSEGEATDLSKNISKIDVSKFFSNSWMNALMMINVVIGLFLLDNYLNTKRKAFRKEI